MKHTGFLFCCMLAFLLFILVVAWHMGMQTEKETIVESYCKSKNMAMVRNDFYYCTDGVKIEKLEWATEQDKK